MLITGSAIVLGVRGGMEEGGSAGLLPGWLAAADGRLDNNIWAAFIITTIDSGNSWCTVLYNNKQDKLLNKQAQWFIYQDIYSTTNFQFLSPERFLKSAQSKHAFWVIIKYRTRITTFHKFWKTLYILGWIHWNECYARVTIVYTSMFYKLTQHMPVCMWACWPWYLVRVAVLCPSVTRSLGGQAWGPPQQLIADTAALGSWQRQSGMVPQVAKWLFVTVPNKKYCIVNIQQTWGMWFEPHINFYDKLAIF